MKILKESSCAILAVKSNGKNLKLRAERFFREFRQGFMA